MKKLYKTPPITNNFSSDDSEAVKAMTAHRSTIRNSENEKQKSNNPVINAMTPPSTAEVIKRKRRNDLP